MILKDLLQSSFGKVTRSGDFLYFTCPLCGKKKRHIHINGSNSNCWYCEQPLSLFELDVTTFGETYIQRDESEKETAENPQSRIWPATKYIPINELPEKHEAIQFLKKDHLHDYDRYWREYRLAYIPGYGGIRIGSSDKPEQGMFTGGSLIFPVYFNEEYVGWQLRFMPSGGKQPRLKYFHIFPKGNYLVNYDKAKNYPCVIVVEGYKKMLKHPQCVATLGKGISDHQINLLSRWRKIILALDAGEKEMEKMLEIKQRLNQNREIYIVDFKKHGFPSPDETTEKEFENIIMETITNG